MAAVVLPEHYLGVVVADDVPRVPDRSHGHGQLMGDLDVGLVYRTLHCLIGRKARGGQPVAVRPGHE